MTARATAWFEDEDPRNLLRWGAAAVIVLAVHAAIVAAYFLWRPPEVEVGDESSVISVEITVSQVEQVEQPKIEQPKIEPPPPKPETTQEALPEPKPPEKVEETRPSPRTTARVEGGAPRIDTSWQTLLVKQLQRFMNYPPSARARGEQGVGLLAFTVDRSGHVLARHVVRTSGFPDLDAEMMALIERAQPLPAFPAGMAQDQLELTVPIRFSLR
jgi:protein TonB